MNARASMIAYMVASEPLVVKRTASAWTRSQSSSAMSTCSSSVMPSCRPRPVANASARPSVTIAGL